MWSILLYKIYFYFFYFDSLWIDRNRHCNESVAWFYELRPDQLLCWSKQRFSRPYCNLLWRFDQLLGSGLIFMMFNFLQIIASEKQVGKYFQILFRDGIYHWPEFIFWYWLKYLYLILEHKILLLYYCGIHHCLIIFIFLEISRLFLSDCFLGISNL